MNQQRTGVYVTLVMLGSLGTPQLAAALDPEAGKAVFQQQCTVCHTAEPNDNGGAQGPSLQGVYGRKAASDPSFTYTQALRDAKITWNEHSLNRFLSAPSAMVPGTAMAVAVTDREQRANLVAYFKWIKANPPAKAPAAATGAVTGESDWKKDAPGRAHKIDLAALPAPFATPSARNNPKLVPRPAYAQLLVPKGFKVGLFAKDLEGPRKIAVTPGGDLFVTETRGGRISVLHPAPDGRSSARTDVFADGLDKPFGIAFYPNAEAPKWLYVAETNRVIRFAFKKGDVKANGAPEVVIPQLSASTGGHSTRDIAFSPDGRRLYVSVGSQSNVAESMSKKSPEQVKEWDKARGLGATWDVEENRADVLVFDVDSKGPGKVFASGIRNCVSLTMQPKTNSLWCTTNERDLLGDDLVPDYSTRVAEGSFFGWPWYYMGSHEDPRLKGDRPDLKDKVSVPDVPYQAHSAALGLIFYTATSGKSAFPAEYVGDGFAMLHGSWNRGFRTGHKVVRVRMNNGVPTGEYDDFLTGFIVDDGDAWGRPVSGAVLGDGSLLVSDDGGNVIFRISYEP